MWKKSRSSCSIVSWSHWPTLPERVDLCAKSRLERGAVINQFGREDKLGSNNTNWKQVSLNVALCYPWSFSTPAV